MGVHVPVGRLSVTLTLTLTLNLTLTLALTAEQVAAALFEGDCLAWLAPLLEQALP